ncbi:phosphatase PAP2 family protein [Micromonospora sp. WMMD1102]|uniref:phosphatase PAP2 family protein n=1 Tax=Micromonospora sp. WMMD1102 TaxID=3016105 RepID=UPI0024154EF0|nr:phosphatase PAP2 family protein [Micromonospora sp. WMMD1102]MDG4788798.1 phosphatase PAP2 family protein [Micromonospora sp. WMMD1102]
MRRILLVAPLFLLSGAAMVLLAPGGLGDPRPRVVTEGPSAAAYRGMAGRAGELPGWLHTPGEYAAAAGLLVLAGLLARVGWLGWRRHRTSGALGVLLVGVGTVLAYLVSEGVKLVVDQERPCRAFADVSTWVACPPVGDWSFPSNHATLAGGLAAGLVLLAPRLWYLAVPMAGAVAALRVATGVHYPHDVLAGLLLGATASAALLIALRPAPTSPTAPRPAPGH